MQYPPLTQFGQTNLAKLHLSPYYMRKDSIVIKVDASGNSYATMAYNELSKNHKNLLTDKAHDEKQSMMMEQPQRCQIMFLLSLTSVIAVLIISITIMKFWNLKGLFKSFYLCYQLAIHIPYQNSKLNSKAVNFTYMNLES